MLVSTQAKRVHEHFADSVPDELRRKLQAIALIVKEDFIGQAGSGESYGDNSIDAISGISYPGFIPFQLGGFEVSALYSSDIDSSYHLTKGHTQFVQNQEKAMYESFMHDHKELNLAEGYSYSDLSEDAQNEFSDYENEWFEPALLRFEIWVDDEKQTLSMCQDGKAPDRIFARLSLAYSDAPYYRSDKDDDTLGEWNFSSNDMPNGESMVKLLEKAIADCR